MSTIQHPTPQRAERTVDEVFRVIAGEERITIARRIVFGGAAAGLVVGLFAGALLINPVGLGVCAALFAMVLRPKRGFRTALIIQLIVGTVASVALVSTSMQRIAEDARFVVGLSTTLVAITSLIGAFMLTGRDVTAYITADRRR